MRLLVIIPAYNEEMNIENVVENLRENYPQYDYVVINDGSTDRTSQICHEKGYNIVDLPINLGLAGAFKTGMKYACRYDYDMAIQLDADGQHNPKYIAIMAEEMGKGYDIILGSRFKTEKKPFTPRMLGSRLISLAIRVSTGRKITDPTAGMRMYNKKMIQEFATHINYGPEPDTISFLVKQGASVHGIQVEMEERKGGVSYLNLPRSVMYMTRMLLSILFIQNFRKRDI